MESLEYFLSINDDNHVYPKTIVYLSPGGFVFLTNDDKAKLFENLYGVGQMEKFEVD